MKNHLLGRSLCLAVGLGCSITIMEVGIRSTFPTQIKAELPPQPAAKPAAEEIAEQIERAIKPPPKEETTAVCPTYHGCRQWVYFNDAPGENANCHLVNALDLPSGSAMEKIIPTIELPATLCKSAGQRPAEKGLPTTLMTAQGVKPVVWACADHLRSI